MRATALVLLTTTVLMSWSGHCLAQAPLVESVTPAENAINIPINSVIQVDFDMNVTNVDATTFLVRGRSCGQISGVVSPTGPTDVYEFTPDAPFAYGELITVTLTDDIQSQGREPFAGYSWSFTVTAICDISGDFASEVTYPVGAGPLSVISADFNNDGNLDLVTANTIDNNVSIKIGMGDGTFTDPTPSTHPTGDNPKSVFAADFNNDGNLDLVTANNNPYGNDNVYIMLGDGDCTFTNAVPPNHPIGDNPSSVFAADLDNDGNLDLITSNLIGDNLSIMLGNGDGTFTDATPPTHPVGDAPYSVYAGDLDNDGKLDLVTANYFDDNVSIMKGNGDGTFADASPPNHPVGTAPYSVFAADFDNDGNLDLVVGNTGSNNLWIMLGNGDCTFTDASPFTYPTGDFPSKVFVADINSDDNLDLVTNNIYSNNLSIILGNGDGTFTNAEPPTLPVGSEPQSVFAADFDNDGNLDLVSANSVPDNNVSIILNVPKLTAVASVSPAPESLNVPIDKTITVTFERDMDPNLFSLNTFKVNGSLSGLVGEEGDDIVTYDIDNLKAEFTHTDPFQYGEVVTVTLTDGIQLGCGAPMTPYTWSFTTKVEDGTGVFNAAIPYNYGAQAKCVRAADFNSDGYVDVAASIPVDSLIAIFINDQAGGFYVPPQETPQVIDIEEGKAPWYISAAELTGDTYTDLIAVGESKRFVSYNPIFVYLNSTDSPDPTLFTDIDYYGTGDSYRWASEVSAADFDGDGDLDLVVVRSPYMGTWNNMSVYFNDGTGHFTDPAMQFRQFDAHGFDAVCTGDFDGNGSMDIAGVGWYYYAEVPVLFNNGDGTFAEPVNIGNWGFHADAIYPADLNGDGLLDLVIPYTPPASDSYVQIVLNDFNEPGTFYLNASYVLAHHGVGYVMVNDVEAADVDMDGDLDLVVGVGLSWVDVMLNDGTGGFFTDAWHSDPRYQRYFTPGGSSEISVADYNRDGSVDIVSISPNGIALLTNQARGSIAGMVSDGVNPLDNVIVVAQGIGTVDTTDSIGEYILDHLAAGFYDLAFSRDDYHDTTVTAVEVTVGDMTTLDVMMAGLPGFVVGSVTDGGRNPVDGVIVSALGTGIEDTTDSSGNYSLDTLAVGSYNISFSHEDYRDTVAIGIAITPADTTSLDMVMEILPGFISGIIMGPGSVPIEGVYAELRTPEIPPLVISGGIPLYDGSPGIGKGLLLEVIDSTYTDINGYFEFYVDPGLYDLWLSHEDFNDTLITGIVASPGDSTVLPDIPLSPSGCDYVTGDANGSGSYNGLDITYGVAYLKGGNPPQCDSCLLCPDWHYCADVNGSCNYNGLDITYGVAFLKGGAGLVPCGDCPQVSGITGRPGGNIAARSLKHPAGINKAAGKEKLR